MVCLFLFSSGTMSSQAATSNNCVIEERAFERALAELWERTGLSDGATVWLRGDSVSADFSRAMPTASTDSRIACRLQAVKEGVADGARAAMERFGNREAVVGSAQIDSIIEIYRDLGAGNVDQRTVERFRAVGISRIGTLRAVLQYRVTEGAWLIPDVVLGLEVIDVAERTRRTGRERIPGGDAWTSSEWGALFQITWAERVFPGEYSLAGYWDNIGGFDFCPTTQHGFKVFGSRHSEYNSDDSYELLDLRQVRLDLRSPLRCIAPNPDDGSAQSIPSNRLSFTVYFGAPSETDSGMWSEWGEYGNGPPRPTLCVYYGRQEAFDVRSEASLSHPGVDRITCAWIAPSYLRERRN